MTDNLCFYCMNQETFDWAYLNLEADLKLINSYEERTLAIVSERRAASSQALMTDCVELFGTDGKKINTGFHFAGKFSTFYTRSESSLLN